MFVYFGKLRITGLRCLNLTRNQEGNRDSYVFSSYFIEIKKYRNTINSSFFLSFFLFFFKRENKRTKQQNKNKVGSYLGVLDILEGGVSCPFLQIPPHLTKTLSFWLFQLPRTTSHLLQKKIKYYFPILFTATTNNYTVLISIIVSLCQFCFCYYKIAF